MSMCNCNQGRTACTCKGEPVPAGFASGRDEDNQVLLDKRDLFDAVRGALKEQMQALPFGDAADLWAEATAAADECLKDLVSKGSVPPAGDVEVIAIGYTGVNGYVRSVGQYKGLPISPMDIALVDRAHVTRLTAERDGLLEKLADTEECYRSAALREDLYGEELKSTSDELTKARELLTDIYMQNDLSIYDDQRIDKFLNPPTAAPIAHNVDESCGQDAEAAKDGA